MDFTLMASSLPKLLGAAIVTLKLLSLSLFFGIFITYDVPFENFLIQKKHYPN